MARKDCRWPWPIGMLNPTNEWTMLITNLNRALILVRDGREQGLFENPNDCPRLLDPILIFKKACSIVRKYQITAIPLSFIQAVTLTVHSFGLASLMGKQFVDINSKLLVIDCYLPILPTMQVTEALDWLIHWFSSTLMVSTWPTYPGWNWLKWPSILSETTMTTLMLSASLTVTSR